MKYITAQLKSIKKAAKQDQGFTLIELLVVIGILAILMGIVLIAINPARQFALANNTTRANAVNQILNAVGQYAADNKGAIPGIIPTGVDNTAAKEIASGNGNVELCSVLVPTYIPAFPEDPKINNGQDITQAGCTAQAGYDSGYSIWQDANHRVTVLAPNTENPPATSEIQVSR